MNTHRRSNAEQSFLEYVYRVKGHTNCDSRDHDGIIWADKEIKKLRAALTKSRGKQDGY
jgi:hypothetical protein